MLDIPSSLLLTFWWLLLDDDEEDEEDEDLFLSPREEEYDEYGSLSCLFVLDEILFTFLLLLELCLPSLSFSFDDVREDDVEPLDGGTIMLEDGAVELLEYGICAFDDEFFVLLDFFCLLLLDDDDDNVVFVVARGSVGRFEREECDISESFSGDDGESLECASCDMGLYGGIGFTLPPFF